MWGAQVWSLVRELDHMPQLRIWVLQQQQQKIPHATTKTQWNHINKFKQIVSELKKYMHEEKYSSIYQNYIIYLHYF